MHGQRAAGKWEKQIQKLKHLSDEPEFSKTSSLFNMFSIPTFKKISRSSSRTSAARLQAGKKQRIDRKVRGLAGDKYKRKRKER